MRRLGLAFLAALFFLLWIIPLSAQQDDPSEIFLKAYLSAQQGEKLEHENRFKTALAKFRFAGSLIEELRRSHSDWQPAIVEYRGRKIGEGILRVQERISRHDELSAAASPLPEVVPSLPENEAWSEPGPEVVDPQRLDTISQGPSGGAIQEANRQINAVEQQRDKAIAQLKAGSQTEQHPQALLGENGDLKLKLADLEENAPAKADSTSAEELVGVKQEVTQLQQQLAESQKG